MLSNSEVVEAMLPPDKLQFNEIELSELTGVKRPTLQAWRHKKRGGPAFVRLGKRIVYPRQAVVSWMETQYVVTAPLHEPKTASPQTAV